MNPWLYGTLIALGAMIVAFFLAWAGLSLYTAAKVLKNFRSDAKRSDAMIKDWNKKFGGEAGTK